MEILVTGCSGFVGANLSDLLLEKGHHVFCMSRSTKCKNSNRSKHISHDITKPLEYNLLPSKIDCIIHLAATMDKSMHPSQMFLTNTLSTLNLLEYGSAANIKRFLFASSGAVYGYSEGPLTEDSPINPSTFYGLSKYQSELLISHYRRKFSTIILRLSFPYGAGQVMGVVPQLFGNIKNKREITIYNDGNPRINPTYVDDVTGAIEKSLRLEGQHILNVCGDEDISILELSLLIGRFLQQEPVFEYKSDSTIKDLIMINTRMKDVLNNKKMISLSQGLQTYINCIQQ